MRQTTRRILIVASTVVLALGIAACNRPNKQANDIKNPAPMTDTISRNDLSTSSICSAARERIRRLEAKNKELEAKLTRAESNEMQARGELDAFKPVCRQLIREHNAGSNERQRKCIERVKRENEQLSNEKQSLYEEIDRLDRKIASLMDMREYYSKPRPDMWPTDIKRAPKLYEIFGKQLIESQENRKALQNQLDELNKTGAKSPYKECKSDYIDL